MVSATDSDRERKCPLLFSCVPRLFQQCFDDFWNRFYIKADEKGVAGRKALEGAEIPDDLQIKATDPKNAAAYPIATYTWVLCRKKYPAAKAHEVEMLKAVLRFSLEDRQQDTAASLGYLRLPEDVIKRVSADLEKIAVGP